MLGHRLRRWPNIMVLVYLDIGVVGPLVADAAVALSIPRKDNTLKQCCFNVGPNVPDANPTIKQHCLDVYCF